MIISTNHNAGVGDAVRPLEQLVPQALATIPCARPLQVRSGDAYNSELVRPSLKRLWRGLDHSGGTRASLAPKGPSVELG